jgi:hypothetical protein
MLTSIGQLGLAETSPQFSIVQTRPHLTVLREPNKLAKAAIIGSQDSLCLEATSSNPDILPDKCSDLRGMPRPSAVAKRETS